MEDDPDVEFYGMSVFRRNGWHIGLLEYWRSSKDEISIHQAFSRDGRNWIRPINRVPFIAPEYDWNRKWNSCASNGPVIIKEQMAFYLGARRVSHHYDSIHQHGVIGIASIPLDRFCAVEALAEGLLVTVPIKWPGGELIINADTRESFESHSFLCNGICRVELLDSEGMPLPGWSGNDNAVFQGNTHCRGSINEGLIQWPESRKMDSLKGKVIRLCFRMRHARMFTFEARKK